MNLFQLYMLFFGFSTVVGVPLLSSFQVTQIKNSTWGDWAGNLGTTLGPAAGILVIISLIVYTIMKPLMQIIKKAETEAISDAEKDTIKNWQAGRYRDPNPRCSRLQRIWLSGSSHRPS